MTNFKIGDRVKDSWSGLTARVVAGQEQTGQDHVHIVFNNGCVDSVDDSTITLVEPSLDTLLVGDELIYRGDSDLPIKVLEVGVQTCLISYAGSSHHLAKQWRTFEELKKDYTVKGQPIQRELTKEEAEKEFNIKIV